MDVDWPIIALIVLLGIVGVNLFRVAQPYDEEELEDEY